MSPTRATLSDEPTPPASSSITALLQRWNDGDVGARDEVLTRLYDELHRIAERHYRRERRHLTLQATAVVHEAFLVLAEQGVHWQSRSHFVGLAARVMRRVLIDHAREMGRAKRGGNLWRVTLSEAAQLAVDEPPDVVAVDDALTSLAAVDARKAALVELRFFGGLTLDEAADLLGISRATATREWRSGRAFLYRELRDRAAAGEEAEAEDEAEDEAN